MVAPPTAAASDVAPEGIPLTLRQAVASALVHQPALALADTAVTAREAELLAARAPFDPVFSTTFGHDHATRHLLPSERTDPSQSSLTSDTTSLDAAVSVGLRWGTRITPKFSLQRAKQLHVPRPAQLAGAELDVVQPLLRGRGEVAALAELRAAEHNRAAARAGRAHNAQEQALNAIVAYFQLVAASANLRDYRVSVERARQLFEETQALVEAEHRTESDLRQVEASWQRQTSLMQSATGDVALARYDLALAMGLDGRSAPEWWPVDEFPSARLPHALPQAWVDRALATRRDLVAARESAASADVLVAGAERNTSPALDLNLSVGYTGAVDRDGVGSFFGAAFENVEGLNAGAALKLELPVQNAAARAALDLRRANLRGARISQTDLARQVRVGVQRALSDLQLSAAALSSAERAVTLLSQLVQDERAKLHEGFSTIIDVVLTEERLTEALLTRTAQRLRYTLARAQLTFERGALPGQESALAPSVEALLDLGDSNG